MSAGKGDKPRNCFSKRFKDNYDDIDWGNKYLVGENLDKMIEKFSEIKEEFSKKTANIKPAPKNNFIKP
jgi:hypothetical protein